MNNDASVNLTIKPTWSLIKQIQDKSNQYMQSRGYTADLTEATMMCATELIENAIKYGAEQPDSGNIEFNLIAENNVIRIKITNGVESKTHIQNVKKNIKKIQKAKNPAKLYTERLMELMENPKPGVSQLGLYRIAYEGEFSLEYHFENNILTVIAQRKI